MSIDPSLEKLISFHELARSLPSRRNGRPLHVSTIHRWRSRGLGGIRLEAVRIGGAWHSSEEAFSRFTARLTARAESEDFIEPLNQCLGQEMPGNSRDGIW